MQTRALNGVKQDIVALTEIPHVGQSSARRLFNEGLRTAEVIAKASADVIFNTLCKGGQALPCLWPRSWAITTPRGAGRMCLNHHFCAMSCEDRDSTCVA